MRRALTIVLAGVVGLAAWVTLGGIGLIDAGGGADTGLVTGGVAAVRVALLPSPLWAAIVAAIALVWFVLRPRAAGAAGLIALTLLPWLPIDLPASWRLWTGPLAAVLWGAVLIAALVASGVSVSERARERLRRWTHDPQRAVRLAFAIAAVAYLAGLWLAARTVPGGDEPHYLIIARSLVSDGDLRIENNHARLDYLPFFEGELKPDFLKRGVDRAIYSIHAPGLPVVIAPALALFGHRGAMVFLALVSAFGAALVWRMSWVVSRDVSAAWFGWAATTLTAPFFLHAFTVYPDALASVLVVSGVLAFVRAGGRRAAPGEAGNEEAPSPGIGVTSVDATVTRRRLWRSRDEGRDEWASSDPLTIASACWHGVALAGLPWLHTRYALLAAALGGGIVIRLAFDRRVREIGAFLILPILSACGWFAFFLLIYGTPNPTAPYGGYTQTAFAHVLPGLTGLLVDQQFGLLAAAPVLVLALVGIGAMLTAKGSAGRRRELVLLALMLLAVIVPYAVATAAYRMWWGGFSAPARFLVPIVLPLAAPLAVLWVRARSSATRSMAIWMLLWSVTFAWMLVAVDAGAMAWVTRTPVAAWAQWVSPMVDVARGLPSVHRGPLAVTLLQTLAWATIALVSWGALLGVERRAVLSFPRVLSVWAPLTLAVTVMAGLAAGWWIEGARPLRPAGSQLALVNRAAAIRPRVGLTFEPATWPWLAVHRLSPVGALAMLRLPAEVLPAASLPAGRYRVRVVPRVEPPGSVRVFVGRSATPIALLDASAAPPVGAGRARLLDFVLPVRVTGLTLRPEGGSAGPGDVTLQPMMVTKGPASATLDAAGLAAAYGDVAVYFIGDGVFPEAAGFWVRAGTDATVAIVHPEVGAPLEIRLRNAPIDNRVSIVEETGTLDQRIDLTPGAEHPVAIPSPGASRVTVLRIRADRGVRPAEQTPGNRDMRLLGVWVELAKR
jgi:hypothetical protein